MESAQLPAPIPGPPPMATGLAPTSEASQDGKPSVAASATPQSSVKTDPEAVRGVGSSDNASCVSQKVANLFQSKTTITAEVAASPEEEIHKIAHKLYKSNGYHLHGSSHVKQPGREPCTQADLDAAAACGNFPYRPSDLFLKVYAQVLRLLDYDALASMVSPPLLASSGVVTLSIVSVIPDIVRHMADVIVQAEREVFLTTNYWEASTSAKVITDAFRELDRRAGKRGQKIVVKVVYDRGNLGQLSDPHQLVPAKEFTGEKVKLPKPEEVPNLELEVCNYHRPVLGTMHGKWMVVDRRVAILNSNNIQDRVNVEMMTHIEGDIVQAFYDLCLVTWHHAMHPPLPLVKETPQNKDHFDFGEDHAQIQNQDLDASRKAAIDTLKSGEFTADKAQEQGKGERRNTYEVTPGAEAQNDEEDFNSKKGESKMAAITKRLNTTLNPDLKGTDFQTEDMTDFNPHILHKPCKPFPMAMVNRKPRGSLDFKDVDNPQDTAWIAAMENAEREIFIQTPTFTAPPAVDAVLRAVRRGVRVVLYADLGFNDAGEALPKQGGTNEEVISKMFKEIEDQYKDNFQVYWYTAKDMIRPMNASQQKRNCHVKIMIVDGKLGIQGNGNQDAQSWFHSLEANVMVDSEQVCAEWRAGLDANQNTLKHGRLQNDGIWRDPKTGEELADAGSTKGGVKMLLKGITGTIAVSLIRSPSRCFILNSGHHAACER